MIALIALIARNYDAVSMSGLRLFCNQIHGNIRSKCVILISFLTCILFENSSLFLQASENEYSASIILGKLNTKIENQYDDSFFQKNQLE